jgi:TatD DNase family protein
MVIDSHAHLTDARFASEVGEVITRARGAGVECVVTIGSDLQDSESAIAIAESAEGVYAAVGVHPHVADSVGDATIDRLRDLARHPRVVAIGETGLDFHYDNSARAAQRESFRRHLALATELDLPVVVHSRSADDEIVAILREAGWPRGVLHCFSGGPALLEAALELGWYISFAGMITFPKWASVDLLRAVPLDRLLVETDSPYLAPVPHRGRRNEPAFVPLIAERAAVLRGEDAATLFRQTTLNARTFYGVVA